MLIGAYRFSKVIYRAAVTFAIGGAELRKQHWDKLLESLRLLHTA